MGARGFPFVGAQTVYFKGTGSISAFVGFSSGEDSGHHYDSIDCAPYVYRGNMSPYENGSVPVDRNWRYNKDRDVLAIDIAEDGTVSYLKNGETWFTCSQKLAFPVYLDTGLRWHPDQPGTRIDFLGFANPHQAPKGEPTLSPTMSPVDPCAGHDAKTCKQASKWSQCKWKRVGGKSKECVTVVPDFTVCDGMDGDRSACKKKKRDGCKYKKRKCFHRDE